MPDGRFPQTSWTDVVRAGELTPDGRRALSALCEAYWFPVYAFVRRRGASAEEARDRTQEFFTRRLVEKNALASFDRARGTRFRSWLLGCVKNHLRNEHDREHAEAAGGRVVFESLDAAAAESRYQVEALPHLTPERLFDRAFAERLIERVVAEVQAKYAAAGKAALFEALKGTLTANVPPRPHGEVAALLGRTEGDVRKAAFDLREVYKKKLRAEVARLVADPDGAEDREALVREEALYLLQALED
jgi:DNA-directed RNA polymerase specialized sigma24 family protein